jgi:ubiquinone/menaquinone biosynthesis C-methylase UbiE
MRAGARWPYREHMTLPEAETDAKAAARAMWALGDYHRFACETVWEVGPVLVEACRVRPGIRVLDVAAGTGNVAIRAAQAGAVVVAADLTPEHFDAGRREARNCGVELEWVEADAEALPFADASFDVVTSSFGAMFAPDHEAVAAELLRVCRSGGTIGMANFTPEGLGGTFFGTLAPYLPPPPPATQWPLAWGTDAHVRSLFGEHVGSLTLERRTYAERCASPEAYRALFEETFGPVIALRAAHAGDAERAAALDADLAAFAESANRASPGEPAEYVYEYLLVVAHKR